MLRKENTEATVIPVAGAMVASFRVNGKNIFYPLQEIQTSNEIKKRGGSPILFPNAGALPADGEFSLPQNGFARDLPWRIKTQTDNSIALTLLSSEETEKIYPYQFELVYMVSVFDQGLTLVLQVTNQSNVPMPTAPGFHPYFSLPYSSRNNLKTNLSSFNPTEYTGPEVLSFGHQDIDIETDEVHINIHGSPNLKRLSIWTELNKDFLCFEPWVGNVGALYDPKQRCEVAPGESARFAVEINVLRVK